MKLLKKQSVAWIITIALVIAAVGIGCSKGGAPKTPQQDAVSCVWDDAQVLSDRTVRTLDDRNDRLWNRYSVTIGVVTCNYNRDDLYEYAMEQFEEMGLGSYDMIVVLDIRGDNYWLYTGNDVAWDFSDQDCMDYTYSYMENWFARGNYDNAVLDLTEALEAWYRSYYN